MTVLDLLYKLVKNGHVSTEVSCEDDNGVPFEIVDVKMVQNYGTTISSFPTGDPYLVISIKEKAP